MPDETGPREKTAPKWGDAELSSSLGGTSAAVNGHAASTPRPAGETPPDEWHPPSRPARLLPVSSSVGSRAQGSEGRHLAEASAYST